MQPRHPIDKDYEANPRHLRRWELTIEWLKQFDISKMPQEVSQIMGNCLDCGDRTNLTGMISAEFLVKTHNTTEDLDWELESLISKYSYYDNIFIFEVIEHLMNPALFLRQMGDILKEEGSVYLSTPINRPKWMRNREWHFHEFNYNELEYLIDKAGFKIVDEKRINCTRWYYALTGFRPLLRVLGYDKNILIRMRRK